MAPNTQQQKFWATTRRGWVLSVVIGLVVLLVRFKALIPLVWQMLVKNGSTHAIGNALDSLLLLVAVIGGGALFVYAVRIGYRRVSLALEFNGTHMNTLGRNPSDSSVAVHIIGRTSLFINAPILYWAAFLFVLLPQLIKIPNASLRIGTTAALAGAFISMVVIVVLATHIGLLLTKFSFRSITKAPELAALPSAGGTIGIQPLPYAQQVTYVPNPQAAGMNNQAGPYGQQGNYYSAPPSPATPVLPSGGQPSPYTQQSGYVQQVVYPANPQMPGMNNGPANQGPEVPGQPRSNSQP